MTRGVNDYDFVCLLSKSVIMCDRLALESVNFLAGSSQQLLKKKQTT